ncbi:MAG: helix-turn-helix transcriptional regulator [Chloroflexota bacterium]
MAALKEVGLALSASRGAHGGVRLENFGRVLLVLTPAEVTAVLLAATIAGDMPYAKAAKTATGTLAETLPPATRVQVESLCRRIQVVPAGMPSRSPRERSVLEDALRVSRVVRIGYTDRNGQRTEHAELMAETAPPRDYAETLGYIPDPGVRPDWE